MANAAVHEMVQPVIQQSLAEDRRQRQRSALRQRADGWPFTRTNQYRLHLNTPLFLTTRPESSAAGF